MREAVSSVAVGVLTEQAVQVANKLSEKLSEPLTSFLNYLTPSNKSKERLERAISAIAPGSPGIWRTQPVAHPQNYAKKLKKSIPITVICNSKGGVGKTTIAANVAAYFAKERDQRVLAIDLDFQGSLTSLILPDERQTRTDFSCKASELIGCDIHPDWVLKVASKSADIHKLSCVSAFTDLAHMENRVMIGWLIGDAPKDIRYALAEILHSDEIQSQYDRIIIDAPPRLTTACVQALCAGTHVLIPTVLDRLSMNGALAFSSQIRDLREICPHIKHLGIVGSIVVRRKNADASINELKEALARRKEDSTYKSRDIPEFIDNCSIAWKSNLVNTGGNKVVFADRSKSKKSEDLRIMFRNLGSEIEMREKLGRFAK